MVRIHACSAVLFALCLGVALQACSGPWLRVHYVPDDGYERTLNYQFQAQVHADSLGDCKLMVVRVQALNKMYSIQEPPSRLQLFDDDCVSPIRFERVQFRSNVSGEQVRLFGSEVVHFFSEYDGLEVELWRAGMI